MRKSPKAQQSASTKSGIMRRPVLESEGRREPPYPPTLPEFKEDEATTGAMQVVSEGRDITAIGDADHAYGN